MQNEEQDKITYLLKNLDEIETPKDFEFQVKKKISVRKSEQTKGFKWWKWAIISPVFAAVLAFSIFWFVQPKAKIEQSTEIAKNVQTETSKIEQPLPANTSVNPTPISESNVGTVKPKNNLTTTKTVLPEKVENKEIAKIEVKPSKSESKVVHKTAVKKDVSAIASNDISISPAETPIRPKGFNQVKNENNLKGFLLTIGVETEQEKGVYRVKKVLENSTGERSGVKANDVIESAETDKTDDNSSPKPITVKSLKIKREKTTMNLPIKP
jgi:hypothetical protein